MAKAEIGLQVNPAELKLSKTEVDKQAFALMVAFRTRLFSLDQFKNAATGAYLNITGDQMRMVDKPRREFGFALGDCEYRVNYSFSGDEQKLWIVKTISGNREDVKKDNPTAQGTREVVILKSRRFKDQKKIRSPEIFWNRPDSSAVNDGPSPQTNTQFAVQRANEMLAGLTPQAPQK